MKVRAVTAILNVSDLPVARRSKGLLRGRVGRHRREVECRDRGWPHISPNTVKNHVSSIYLKLDVSNRTEAGLVGLRIFAFEHCGLDRPPR